MLYLPYNTCHIFSCIYACISHCILYDYTSYFLGYTSPESCNSWSICIRKRERSWLPLPLLLPGQNRRSLHLYYTTNPIHLKSYQPLFCGDIRCFLARLPKLLEPFASAHSQARKLPFLAFLSASYSQPNPMQSHPLRGQDCPYFRTTHARTQQARFLPGLYTIKALFLPGLYPLRALLLPGLYPLKALLLPGQGIPEASLLPVSGTF